MSFFRLLVGILTVAFLLTLPLHSFPVERVEARTIPLHCADLLDGDCDVPWQCIYLCFTELLDQSEYCSQHPTDPACV
jgi:hypothetical protein